MMKRTAVIFAVTAVCTCAVLLGRASPALGACYWDGYQNSRGDSLALDGGYSFVGSTVYWTYGRDCYGQAVEVRIDRIVGSYWATGAYRNDERKLGWAYIYDRANDGLHEWFSEANKSCWGACTMTITYYPGKVVSLVASPDDRLNVSLACMTCNYFHTTSYRYFHFFLQGGIFAEGEYPGMNDGRQP